MSKDELEIKALKYTILLTVENRYLQGDATLKLTRKAESFNKSSGSFEVAGVVVKFDKEPSGVRPRPVKPLDRLEIKLTNQMGFPLKLGTLRKIRDVLYSEKDEKE